MNRALLTKLAWQMLMKPDTLWSKILWAKYGSLFVNKNWIHNTYALWKGILVGVQLLTKAGYQTDAGDLSQTAMQFTIKKCYAAFDDRNKIAVETGKWNKIWRLKGPLRLNLVT